MSSPVQFEKPPVAEVAFSVSFIANPPLPTAFVGIFWSVVRERFSRVSENAPYNNVIEPPAGVMVRPPQIQFQIENLPGLRRTILESGDGKYLIQLQGDKFILNWKRGEDTTYPDFTSAMKDFEDTLAIFEKTLESEKLGPLTYNQYELHYVNLIGPKNGLAVVDEGRVLVDHSRDGSRERFLPPPTGYSWTSSYPLPLEAGRLHVTAQAVVAPPSTDRQVRLDIVARGFPSPASKLDRFGWFEMAHDWITRGFVDSTSPTLHEQVWRKK